MDRKPYLMCALLLLATFAAAQPAAKSKAKSSAPPATMASTLDAELSHVESDFVSAADAMPADKYDFAPSNGEFKGVRTFAMQVKHVAAVNYIIAAAMAGEKPPVDVGTIESGPDTLKTKAEIMQYLKDSFAYTHKVFATLAPQNALKPVPLPWDPKNNSTRLGMAAHEIAHPFDHYGQMVEYLRMNGIVPPASRPQPQPAQ